MYVEKCQNEQTKVNSKRGQYRVVLIGVEYPIGVAGGGPRGGIGRHEVAR
jgi:hypothetical protein